MLALFTILAVHLALVFAVLELVFVDKNFDFWCSYLHFDGLIHCCLHCLRELQVGMLVLALCATRTATRLPQIGAVLPELDISLLANLEKDVCHLLLFHYDSLLLLFEANRVFERLAFSIVRLLISKSELFLTSMCTSVLDVIDYVPQESIRNYALSWVLTFWAFR